MTPPTTAAGVGWTATPTEELRRTPGKPLSPEDDPFYVPPTGYAASVPGTILRSRDVALALVGRVPQQVRAWQLLVRSTDLNGKPDAFVTTLLLPQDADPAESRPLLSYQCAIDAVDPRCMPSHSLQRGAALYGASPQFELILLMGAIARGWAVAIPDHEGTHGHWGAPREPGYRTLDSIRAATDFEPMGLDADVSVCLWGYSGGGLASSWAAEMAAGYAPELNIVGAVLGSPVGDPGSAFLRLNGTKFAGLPALVIAGLRRVYPDLDRVIRTHSNVAGLALMKSIEAESTLGAVRRLAGFDIADFADVPLADLLAMPEMVEVFEDIQVGMTMPSMPLLVLQAVHDQIIAIDDVDGQVLRYLKGGAHVTYLRDRFSEHLTLHPISTPAAFGWLADRFEGAPLPEAETKTVRSVAFTSTDALFGLIQMGWIAAKVALGRKV